MIRSIVVASISRGGRRQSQRHAEMMNHRFLDVQLKARSHSPRSNGASRLSCSRV